MILLGRMGARKRISPSPNRAPVSLTSSSLPTKGCPASSATISWSSSGPAGAAAGPSPFAALTGSADSADSADSAGPGGAGAAAAGAAGAAGLAGSTSPKLTWSSWENLAIRTIRAYRAAWPGPLLQVAFDLRCRPRLCQLGIRAGIPLGPALAEQIPALVECLLGGPECGLLQRAAQLAGGQSGAQFALGRDQIGDVPKDLLVIHGPTLRRRYVDLMQLTRERIVAAAVRLIEREGVTAISMRRIAGELGCAVMSLYNHVPGKDALLDGVAEHVLAGIEVPVQPDASWQEQVRAQARAFRQIARAHPRCTMVVVSRPNTSAAALRPFEQALSTLADAGFGGADSVRMVRTFIAYVLGCLLREVGVAP